MRIKKVSQTTSTQAKIVDGYSTSTVDGYSCNYVNNLAGKILWTNSDPTQAISQTTNISLSSNDYDILEVIYAQSTINTDLMYSTKFLKGGSTRMRISSTDGSNMYRGITYLTDTSYRIDLPYSDNTKIAVSTMSIPLYIIGYKTGLFS